MDPNTSKSLKGALRLGGLAIAASIITIITYNLFFPAYKPPKTKEIKNGIEIEIKIQGRNQQKKGLYEILKDILSPEELNDNPKGVMRTFSHPKGWYHLVTISLDEPKLAFCAVDNFPPSHPDGRIDHAYLLYKDNNEFISFHRRGGWTKDNDLAIVAQRIFDYGMQGKNGWKKELKGTGYFRR